MSLDGQVYWSAHPPGVSYPSDANEVSPGRYIVADYSSPGQVAIFSRTAQLVWRFRPGRRGRAQPSIARAAASLRQHSRQRRLQPPRDRDQPEDDKIVWQYGHDSVPGRAAGYLDNPDGVDLAPRRTHCS
jgi:hypothetical protein